jgi:hypothetical protein
MSAEYRVLLKRSVRPATAAAWLARTKAADASATANAAGLVPVAALAQQLHADTAALDVAQAAAAGKGEVAMRTRDAMLRAVQRSYRAYVGGVQVLCDQSPDPAHALAVAAAAGIPVAGNRANHRAPFYGKATGAGGVHLYARLPARWARCFHEWEMSTNGGASWVSLPATNDADLLVADLTPATYVAFRHRTTAKNETTEWSQSFVVLVR